MNFTTSTRKESKTYPGVFYTLNKMSEAKRANLRLRIAEPTMKIRNLIRELKKLEDLPEEMRTEDVLDRMTDLLEKMDLVSAQDVDPQWLLWGLKKIEGLDIDDVPATPESLLEAGPPLLFDEIVEEIKKVAQLNGEDEKNSESPIISGEQTVGTTTDTTATIAGNGATSEIETVASSTQN